MVSSISKLSSLFLSITALLIGHGLQQTLIPLKAQELGWAPSLIGISGAAYFVGFILGCFFVPQLIRQVGHIRVFAFSMALLTLSILAIGTWQQFGLWLAMRALTGASMAGIYMIFESWLNEQASDRERGSILSFYGLICVGSLVIGQLLLLDLDLASGAMLVAMLFALGVAPVALTTSPQPAIPEAVHPDFRFTHRASQVALVCAATSGVVMGLIWSNGAVFASAYTDDPARGAQFVLFALLGGMVAQLPVGRLSDRIDRRWVLLGIAVLGAAASGWWLWRSGSTSMLMVFAALLGATAMPMYSLAIAHANDNAQGRFLQIAGATLVANGIGATAGPLLYAAISASGYANGLFSMFFGAYALTALWVLYRLLVHDVDRSHYEPFQYLPQTTQIAAELDPRFDETMEKP